MTMLATTILATLATLAVAAPSAPIADISVQFTADSVYKHESVIKPKELIEQEDGLYTIILEQDHLLGYCIYDNPDTPYIDGLKFDEEFVSNYAVENVDFTVEHTILIKTVYTDDIAGMLASAKDGDWSRVLSNPVIILQIVYYVLAAVSLISSGIVLFKSKLKKVKDHNEIASEVKTEAAKSSSDLKEDASNTIKGIANALLEQSKSQNQKIIKALMLSQSKDPTSSLALVDLLKEVSDESEAALSETIKNSIKEVAEAKAKAKQDALEALDKIIDSSSEDFVKVRVVE